MSLYEETGHRVSLAPAALEKFVNQRRAAGEGDLRLAIALRLGLSD